MTHPPTLLVGTTKGAFLMRANAERTSWDIDGPHCDGWGINHMAGDLETGTLWAVGGGAWEGAGIWKSSDDGQTWEVTRLSNGDREVWIKDNPEVAESFGATL